MLIGNMTMTMADNSVALELSAQYSMVARDAWLNLRSDALAYAFQDRPTSLITIDPQLYSLVHSWASPPPRQVGEVTVESQYFPTCSPQMLEEVARSEEFDRGLLIAVTLPPLAAEREVAFVQAIRTQWTNGLPITSEEFVGAFGDGLCFLWMNHRRPPRELSRHVNRLAELHRLALLTR